MIDFSEHTINLFKMLAADTRAENAFWQLHQLYYKRLLAYVISIVHIKENAEEITDDVFVNIWKKRYSFQNINKPELYLFICAKNEALKYLKHNKLSIEYIGDFENIDCVLEQNPHSLLISSETIKSINDAVNALPSKCKLIFRLIKENNLKYKEVAELLDISEKTVENQMTIALKKLTATIPFKLK